MPDITIIIAAYNCALTISRCINSILLASEGMAVEVIVVDDGSSDETPLIVDAISDPRVLVVHTHNGGASVARNVGLSRACGRYVTFVDSDDYISPEYLKTLYAHAQDGNDLVISEAIDVDEEGRVIGGKTTEQTIPILIDEGYDLDAPYAHSTAWGCLYERALIKGQSFASDLLVGEDTLFFHQALLAARSPVHIAFRGYYYVRRSGSIMGLKKSAGYADEALAWERVSALFLGSKELSRQALSISVRRASRGVLFAPDKDDDAYGRMIEYVVSNAPVAIEESLRRRRYRCAALVFIAFAQAKTKSKLSRR